MRQTPFSTGVLEIVAVTAALLVVPWRLVAAPLQAVSLPARTSITAAGNSLNPVLSADGRKVTFVSLANNLVTNDDLGLWLDVFVRDLGNGTTVLVSVNTNGLGGGDDNSSAPTISSNGQYVAFESAASNLVECDTNGLSDVFVRDLASGITRLVSVSADDTPSANGPSGAPLISGDGRWVFFESTASNLIEMDFNGAQDIFARDLLAQTTLLVSADATAAGTNAGAAHSAAITPDGRVVAFVKSATNVVNAEFLLSYGEVYVRDLQLGTTTWASAEVANFFGTSSAYSCFGPALSEDGRFVVFEAASAGGGPVLLFRHDRQVGRTEPIDTGGVTQRWAQVSADGRFVAYDAAGGVYVWDGQAGSNLLVCANSAGDSARGCTLAALATASTRVAFVLTSNNVAAIYASDWTSGSNWLVSVSTNGLPASASDVAAPVISADGRLVLFESIDSTLVLDDWNRAYDIFLRDLDAGRSELVSQRHPGRPNLMPSGISSAPPFSLSADGRVASVLSFDSNLSVFDTNGYPDAFVRDLSGDAEYFLGHSTNGTRDPVLNGDGRFVVYSTSATFYFNFFPTGRELVYRRDLVTGEEDLVTDRGYRATYMLLSSPPVALSSDGKLVAFQSTAAANEIAPGPYGEGNSLGADVFVRNISAGTNQLISINARGTASGNGPSTEPMFSPDDRWLLFRSAANDLSSSSGAGLFARDLMANTTVQVNANFASAGYRPVLAVSADSHFVASVTLGKTIEIFDLLARTSTQVCTSCRNPSLSAEGRWFACEEDVVPVSGGLPRKQIMVRDRLSGTTNLVSHSFSSLSGGNGDSTMPSLSQDGRYVVFSSRASDLVSGDNNGAADVFVHDQFRQITYLVSLNRAGTASGNGPSLMPTLAADGRTVLFQSFASDLVEGDFNDTGDVFVLRLGGPDRDGDGMDDDWELAYFTTLARDGSGDFDGDGTSDLAEFRAGTDPTNVGSVLQVLTLSGSSGGTTKVLWSAIPGRAYRVQFTDSVAEPQWKDAAELVTAGGTTATWLDRSAVTAGQRFYRVVLAP